MKEAPKHILISRTDSIGDVVLTLPMAAALKQCFPGVQISFLGRRYTESVIAACPAVDTFIAREAFLQVAPEGLGTIDTIIHVLPDPEIAAHAKALRIPVRIGTRNRVYHWWTCNKRVKLSRKNSNLHESQLNLKLLQPLLCKSDYSLREVASLLQLKPVAPLSEAVKQILQKAPGPKIILHAKSQGSAREWPTQNFAELAHLLHAAGITVFLSGTEAEKEALQPLVAQTAGVASSIAGLMPLAEFITFINACDGLVAGSTGPLHLAAGLGKVAVGLYPPIRPMHPGRWGPLGPRAAALAASEPCQWCRKAPQSCRCMEKITPEQVAAEVLAGLERSA
jgi:ADP-heptose:LPS heptosyltransferase